MKRWKTTQQMAVEISEMDVSNFKELNIAQCSLISSKVKSLYKHGGKEYVMMHIKGALPSYSANNPNGFSIDQKFRALNVVKRLFRWYFLPWSRMRNNMIRIGAVIKL